MANLHYVTGYGFALGNRALDLDGEGRPNEDKLALLEEWRKLTTERDEACKEIERLRGALNGLWKAAYQCGPTRRCKNTKAFRRARDIRSPNLRETSNGK